MEMDLALDRGILSALTDVMKQATAVSHSVAADFGLSAPVKNLVLTPEGIAAKERMMVGLDERMPWSRALDDVEREVPLTLLRKMLEAAGDPSAVGAHA